MKPLILFSSLATICAGGLLALSYQGWQDDPSALSSLSSSPQSAKGDASQAQQSESVAAQATDTASSASETAASKESQQLAKAVEEEVSQPPQPAAAASFDMVRVEEDGSAVLAGRASAGASVKILMDGNPIGETTASERGEWVFIPEAALDKGAHQIQLEETTTAGEVRLSDQTIALTVPDQNQPRPLIVLSEASKPSKVLQKPEAEPLVANNAEPQPEPEIKTAAVEPQPAPQQKPESTATDVDTAKPAESVPATPAETVANEAASEPASTPVAKQPVRNLTVDVVDYDDAGRTTFSGRSQPGSKVRVYVNDRFAGEAVAGDDGTWNLSAGHDIEPGSHTLRTDQLADNGTVNERIELPFFRETTQRIAELQAQRASTVQSNVSAPQPAVEPAAKAETAPAVDQQKNTEVAVAAAPDKTADTSTQGSSQAGAAVVAPVQKEEPVQTATATVAASEEPDKATEEPALTGKVVIQPGNNLWQISRVIYGKGRQYTLIYEANKDQIRNPDRIYPGQIFEAPGSTAPESIDPKCRRPLAECQ